MTRARRLEGRKNAYLYTARIAASRSAGDYTPRLVPYHPDAAVPLEASEILWQCAFRPS
jgi:glycogen phosphorylase